MPLITKNGFSLVPQVDWIRAKTAAITQGDICVMMDADEDPKALVPHFDRITLIAIPFPSFAYGRGFSVARRIRDWGYTGRLRAKGHVISDQFTHALTCGFDEIEIDDALAIRQPEAHWRTALTATLPPYRSRRPHHVIG